LGAVTARRARRRILVVRKLIYGFKLKIKDLIVSWQVTCGTRLLCCNCLWDITVQGFGTPPPNLASHQNHPPVEEIRESDDEHLSRDVDVSILGCCDGQRMRYKLGFWGSVVGALKLVPVL